MAKRGQNEGSIYKRSDGRWVAVLNLGCRNGKRSRKSYYGTTRKEVQEKLNDALLSKRTGLPTVPERLTVGRYLEDWLQNTVGRTMRPRTCETYETHIRLHIVPIIGHVRVTHLTPVHVEGLINDRIEAGLSPQTVRYTLAVLRGALGRAKKWGMISRNVAAVVEPPPERHAEITPFSEQQAVEFLVAAGGDRLEALYAIALAVGLRKGEALGLHWKDVDLEAGEIRVRSALQRVGGRLQLVEPKTARSRRTIALPEDLTARLNSHRTRQLEERLAAGGNWNESGLVFTTTVGTPLDPRNVSRQFHALLKRANLPRFRFHDLRHTCATLLFAQGIHPRVVMDLLGHSQIGITMDIYTHVMPELRTDAASAMDAIIRR